MSVDLTFGLFEQDTQGLVILDDAGEVVLVAEATVQEQHASPASITAYPRERRGQASDHIQPEQATVSTQLIITSTPLLDEADPGRPAAAYERLRRLQSERATVTLITSLLVYEQMGLASVGTPRSAGQGDCVLLDCQWRQIEVVETRTRAVPASILAALTRPSGKDKDKTKDQVKPEGDTAKAARKKTAAKGGLDALSALADAF